MCYFCSHRMSQPSASTSVTMDHHHQQLQSGPKKRREKYVAKIIFAERKFNDLKSKLYPTHKRQIDKQQEAILKQSCPHFLKLKAQIDDEFNAKKMKLDTIHALRLSSLERCRSAENDEAAQRRWLDNEAQIVWELCADRIEHKFKQFREEMHEINAFLRSEIGPINVGDHSVRDESNKISELSNGVGRRQKVFRGNRYLVEIKPNSSHNSQFGSKKKENSSKKVLGWKDIPAMIAKLPQRCIEDDLTIFGSKPADAASLASS